MEQKVGRVVRMYNTRQTRQFTQVLSRIRTVCKSLEFETFHFLFCKGAKNKNTYFVGKENIYQTARRHGALIDVDTKRRIVHEHHAFDNYDGTTTRYSNYWNLETMDTTWKTHVISFQLSDCVVEQKGYNISISKWNNFHLGTRGGDQLRQVQELQNDTIAINTWQRLHIVQSGTIRSYTFNYPYYQFQNGELLICTSTHARILTHDDRSIKCEREVDLRFFGGIVEHKGKSILFAHDGIFSLNVQNLALEKFVEFNSLGFIDNMIQVEKHQVVIRSRSLGLCSVDLSNNSYAQIIPQEEVPKTLSQFTKISENLLFCFSHFCDKKQKIYLLDIQAKTLTFICDGTSPHIIRTKADREECAKRVSSLLDGHVAKDVHSLISQFIM